MNAGVNERKLTATSPTTEGKKKWLGGVVRKVTGGSAAPSSSVPENDDADGMRVDFYLVVFLKFIASIVPTIEVDSTTAF